MADKRHTYFTNPISTIRKYSKNIRDQIISDYLPPDLTGIVSGYIPIRGSGCRYIAINSKVRCVDKYDKIHIELDEDINLDVNEQLQIIKQQLQQRTHENIRLPTAQYNESLPIIKCSVPTYYNSIFPRAILEYLREHKFVTIPLLLRVGVYLNTKFGSGLYAHIVPWDDLEKHEKMHKYKERINKLCHNTKMLMLSHIDKKNVDVITIRTLIKSTKDMNLRRQLIDYAH